MYARKQRYTTHYILDFPETIGFEQQLIAGWNQHILRGLFHANGGLLMFYNRFVN